VEYHRVQYWLSILFLLHINELPSVVDPHTRCRLFADDCLLYRVINNIEDQLQLQKDLAALEAWAADWVCSLIEQVHVMSISQQVSQHHLHYVYQFMWSGFRYCTSGEISWRLIFLQETCLGLITHIL